MLTDRLTPGNTGLQVSAVCIGVTATPDAIVAAFEAGANFFALTSDLHWPIHETHA